MNKSWNPPFYLHFIDPIVEVYHLLLTQPFFFFNNLFYQTLYIFKEICLLDFCKMSITESLVPVLKGTCQFLWRGVSPLTFPTVFSIVSLGEWVWNCCGREIWTEHGAYACIHYRAWKCSLLICFSLIISTSFKSTENTLKPGEDRQRWRMPRRGRSMTTVWFVHNNLIFHKLQASLL